jgi:hypothetical protein
MKVNAIGALSGKKRLNRRQQVPDQPKSTELARVRGANVANATSAAHVPVVAKGTNKQTA